MKKSLLLLGGALVLFSNSAFGWGKMGHDAIAYIAECNLTPKAKKTIEKILGHSIVYYATWMDEWRAEPVTNIPAPGTRPPWTRISSMHRVRKAT